jgi:FtsP/CotA-like multicopper oxidase with cupredoxin domain
MKNTKLYILLGIIILGGAYFYSKSSSQNYFSQSSEIKNATSTEVVDLKNGDTYDLTASYVYNSVAGKTQKMLAYNGSIPALTIRVQQGSEITINFHNQTDLTQLLHSHGIRMDNSFDGSQFTQKEIQPNGSFSYKLKFPDAGVYWYHPHANEVYGQGLGLYGAFIVTPSNPNYFPPVNSEQTIFLSDVPVDGNGNITINKSGTDYSLMGHYGNVLLVNGQQNYNLNALQGEVVRLYLINSANVRPFNFSIKGLKMKLVGGDSGAYEKASFVDSVILAPSERAIVDVYFDKNGTFQMQNNTPISNYVLGTVTVNSASADVSYKTEFNQLQSNQDTISSIDSFRHYFDKTPDKKIAIGVTMNGMMGGQGGMMSGGMMGGSGMMSGGMMGTESKDGIEWEDTMQMMNQMANKDTVKWVIKDLDTGKENMDINWAFKQNQPVKISIFNDPKSMHPMQHPIHFHGQRFLVVKRNGILQTDLVWKDTVLVKSGETVEIILDPSNLGKWMAHCHISEHLADGMMFEFTVEK